MTIATPTTGDLDQESQPGTDGPRRMATKWRSRMSGRGVMLVLATIPALLIIGLILLVLFISFKDRGSPGGVTTLANYPELFGEQLAVDAFVNTIVFTVVTLIVASAFALPFAWLIERTDFGHRKLVYSLMVVKILVPGFLTAMGWIFMLHPRIGAFNTILRSELGFTINITSLIGMGFVQGLGLVSVMFMLTSSSFRNIDSGLEESAKTSGAGPWAALRRITVPLAWPSVLGAMLYTAAIAIGTFDVPLIMGFASRIYTFSTYLYVRVNPVDDLPQYGLAGAASALMIGLGLLASFFYTRTLKRAKKFEVVRGKGYQARAVKLGRWRIVAWLHLGGYMTISMVLPFVFLVYVSTQPYVRPPSLQNIAQATFGAYGDLPMTAVLSGLKATVILVLAVPTLAMLLSALFAWVVLRSQAHFRMAYDYVAFLPQAVPNVIFALGALIVALHWTSGWYDLYGTVGLVIIVLALLNVSFGTRLLNSALVQIHPELEESARASGAGLASVFRRILLPLLKPAFVFGWLWLAMLTFRELSIPLFLASSSSAPLPVTVWNLWNGAHASEAAALSVLMVLAMAPLAFAYLRASKVDA
jgi:iron(III) transport system permease protein